MFQVYRELFGGYLTEYIKLQCRVSYARSRSELPSPSFGKVNQTLQELNLKYFTVPEKSTVLVRFRVENRTFTLVLVVGEQWVDLRMNLARRSSIAGMVRDELMKRMLTAHSKTRIFRFGLDSEGNVGVSSDLAVEDLNSSSLGREVKAVIAALNYFLNEIARPLKIECGDSTPLGGAAVSASTRPETPQIEKGPFEIEVAEVTTGSSTKITITPEHTARQILDEALKKLALPPEASYLLVHNGRKLTDTRLSETARTLEIAQGDNLDVVMIPRAPDEETQTEVLTRTITIQELQRGIVLETRRPSAPERVETDSLILPDGAILPLSKLFVFGRSNLPGGSMEKMLVSRRHFQTTWEDGAFYIEDRNSTNGTKLNNKEIKGTGKHSLRDGDQITVAGVFSILFKARNQDLATASL
jgi:hypothetical protein